MNLAEFNANIQKLAAALHEGARLANEAAAEARKKQQYDVAEELDRRAEALHCAGALAETRGM